MKTLTITVSDEVYQGLHARIGADRIDRFLEGLARPHVVEHDLDNAYRLMASDSAREAEAEEWVEAVAGDSLDETR